MLEQREIAERRSEFTARFGEDGEPDLYFAPGRVNLIGEHTDYNGGLVLPFAISQGTYLLLRPRKEPPALLYSASTDEEAVLDPTRIERGSDWADYPRGVLLLLQERCPSMPPFEAMYFGDLPLGAGLSSSASIEMVTALGSSSLGCHVSGVEAAELCWRAENEFVGMNCGVMDQYAVSLARTGHLLLLDCSTLEYRHVPFNPAGASLVVGHSGVSHTLLSSQYNRRRRECEQALELISARTGARDNLSSVTPQEFEKVRDSLPEVPRRRAEHVIYENLRVKDAVGRLEEADPESLGKLMNESHASLRDLFQASCPEIDMLQEISVQRPGVWGCRITGGGFGGCVIALMRTEAVEAYLAEVPGLYRSSTSRDPFFIIASPSEGARRL